MGSSASHPSLSFRPLKYKYHLQALHLRSISPIYSCITHHFQKPLRLYICLQDLPPTSSRTSVEKSRLSVPSKPHGDISSDFLINFTDFPLYSFQNISHSLPLYSPFLPVQILVFQVLPLAHSKPLIILGFLVNWKNMI